MRSDPGVAGVVYPYTSDDEVDVLASVEVVPRYKGAGRNYFVDFPGFLIFAPKWYGYMYRAEITTRVTLVKPGSNESLGELEWADEYRFRQADRGRSWTQLGWLEVGLVPFIGGFFHIRYDEDQSQPFALKASKAYGQQAARRILNALGDIEKTHGSLARTGAESGGDGARAC